MTTPTAYRRLTVLAPRVQVDVALPVDVPVAELVPMVLQLVGEPVPGSPLRPWRLRGAAGGLLPPAATLDQLGVLDGELLRIDTDGTTPAPPVFDDPVDALASSIGMGGPAQRRCAAVLAVVTATAAAVLLAAGGVLAALAAGLLVAGALAWVARALPERPVGLVTAAAVLPVAAAAGWALAGALVPAAPTRVAAQVAVAALAAGVAAVAGQVALRVVAPALIAVAVAAVPTAGAALAVAWFGVAPGAAAAAAGALALVVGPVLPRAALRLSGLPRPVVPADGAELTGSDMADDPPLEELAERADLARGYLAGLVGGCAVPAAAGSALAAAAGGWAGPVLAGVTAAVLALRARGFANAAPACTQLAAGAAGLVALGLLLARSYPSVAGPAVAAALLLAVGLVLGALHRSRPIGSPVTRRMIDFLEYGLTIAAVPLALAAMGLFTFVRALA